ncbi:hypothetical protein BKA70DRAFT_1221647 [Coprinopsis sp. MPI-PUGE-AT-0042]|nr:hypothetical protein BKA70DRAFT_1221647 [Coprinopsis sp. MPI-PUGE-AT-0042]
MHTSLTLLQSWQTPQNWWRYSILHSPSQYNTASLLPQYCCSTVSLLPQYCCSTASLLPQYWSTLHSPKVQSGLLPKSSRTPTGLPLDSVTIGWFLHEQEWDSGRTFMGLPLWNMLLNIVVKKVKYPQDFNRTPTGPLLDLGGV